MRPRALMSHLRESVDRVGKMARPANSPVADVSGWAGLPAQSGSEAPLEPARTISLIHPDFEGRLARVTVHPSLSGRGRAHEEVKPLLRS
jgi:hypothetical protein